MTTSISGPRRRTVSGRVRLIGLAFLTGALTAAVTQGTAPTAQPATESATLSGARPTAAVRDAVTVSGVSVPTAASAAAPALGSLPSSATTWSDLPTTALNAYQRGAQVIGAVRPNCHLDWAVLAAVGQIESDHGRAGGRQLRADGTSSSLLRGAALDGRGSRAHVADTDGGELDGDQAWDRAVGPMQLLPATWRTVGVDGDGDGVRSADDLDDATLATAVYLCGFGEDLSGTPGAKALTRFNPTPGFAAAVRSLARAYQSNAVTMPWLPSWTVVPYTANQEAASASTALTRTKSSTTPAATSSTEAPTTAGTTPSASPSTTPSSTPSSSSGATPSSGGSPTSTAGSTPSPTPTGSPTTDPSPSEPSSPSGEPTPSDPGPSEPAPSEPTTTPTPDPTTVIGELSQCDDGETAVFCVGGAALDFGDLTATSEADLDGDGALATRLVELTTRLGTKVTVVIADGTRTVVAAVDGHDW